MAGGVGERFWPLSRTEKPKHLWNVAGGDKCLLAQTFERVSHVVASQNIIIITNKEQVRGILESCPEIDPKQIVAEPMARDTSAAIALADMLVKRLAAGKESSFAVFPSDQVVMDQSAFSDTLISAFELAEGGDRLVTIGIVPTHPATGYGYIKRGERFDLELDEFYKVERFFEKPNYTRAEGYIETGEFYWNAGIFVWKTSSISAALKNLIPATYEAFERALKAIDGGKKIEDVLAEEYPSLEKISIDFAVMEKATNTCVVPARFDWDDVGSWSAIERHYEKDKYENVINGEAYLSDVKNSVVFDVSGRATALVGVRDLIVVHTKDATLICAKKSAEDVKTLVRALPQKYR